MSEDRQKTDFNIDLANGFQDVHPSDDADKGQCGAIQSFFLKCFKPCRTKYYDLPKEATLGQRLKFAFMCPPHGNIAIFIQFIFVCSLAWIVLVSLLKNEALPGGNFFSLVVLFAAAVAGGHVFYLIRLPPLLGMLIVGGLFSNVPVIKVVGLGLDPTWSGVLRKIALTVILVRAGLGLDPVALRKMSLTVFRVALIPCLMEVVTEAVAAHFLLGLPWDWSFMLGFVIAAVSPAVVVPSLLNLSERGYGLDKGIPTLVIAAASIDDVFNITGFGVLLGIVFSTGDIALTIAKGPLEALLGIAFGMVFGVFLWYIPSKDSTNAVFYRSVLLFEFGLIATFGSSAVHLSGAGPLGCLTLSLVAAYRWRKERKEGEPDAMANVTAVLWMIFQPLLFVLIGAAVRLDQIKDLDTIGLGIATLAIGQTVRVLFAFLSTLKSGLSLKERIFVSTARFPKATVQAAIGGLALDMALKGDNSTFIHMGTTVLTTAVLSIVITAPIGALAIALSGPRLLNRVDPQTGILEIKKTDDPEKTSMLNE